MATVLTSDPRDVANPACAEVVVAAAVRSGPASLGPRSSDLLRFGWASAAVEAHHELLAAWATSTDPAIRRALMRSPELPPDVAARVVDTRRSGMHTLGANPVAPLDLLAANPGARRRRDEIDRLLPEGLEEATDHPNRAVVVHADSLTVDLVVARSPRLRVATAVALAAREEPPLDPWALAVLVDRFGDAVWWAARGHASAERLDATARLSERASVLAAKG